MINSRVKKFLTSYSKEFEFLVFFRIVKFVFLKSGFNLRQLLFIFSSKQLIKIRIKTSQASTNHNKPNQTKPNQTMPDETTLHSAQETESNHDRPNQTKPN